MYKLFALSESHGLIKILAYNSENFAFPDHNGLFNSLEEAENAIFNAHHFGYSSPGFGQWQELEPNEMKQRFDLIVLKVYK